MTKSKSLTNVVLIYAMGTFSTKVISFVLVFVITFFLTKEEVGIYDIIITTAALVSPFIYLQLTDAILRWMLHENKDGAMTSKVFTNVFVMLLANMLIFSVIYWIAIWFIAVPYKSSIFFVLIAQSTLPLFQLFNRGSGNNTLFAVSGVVYTLFYTILTILFLVFYRFKVEGLLLANAASAIITSLFILIKGKYSSGFSTKHIDIEFSKTLLLYSLPLIPNTLAWWLYSSANRYIVLYFLGLESNGIWAISYKIPTVLTIAHNLFFMAWQEKSMREYNNPNRDSYFSDVLQKYLSLLLGTIIVLVAASKPVLYFIVQKSFFISWKYSTFLLLAILFQSLALFYGMGYFCVKETKKVFFTTIIGSISTIIFSILLVPFFGLYGAGIGAMLGFFVMFIVRLKQTKKYFTIKFPLAKTLYMLTGIAACYGISYSDSIIIQILNNATALSIAIYLNRDFIQSKMNQGLRLYRARFHAV